MNMVHSTPPLRLLRLWVWLYVEAGRGPQGALCNHASALPSDSDPAMPAVPVVGVESPETIRTRVTCIADAPVWSASEL